MKTAIYIEDGIVQLVLTPENDFERDALGSFDRHDIETKIVTGQFYDCQGGWTRQIEQPSQLAICCGGKPDNSLIIRIQPTAAAKIKPKEWFMTDQPLKQFLAEQLPELEKVADEYERVLRIGEFPQLPDQHYDNAAKCNKETARIFNQHVLLNALHSVADPLRKELDEERNYQASLQFSGSARQGIEIERDFLIQKLKKMGVEISREEWPTDFAQFYTTQLEQLRAEIDDLKHGVGLPKELEEKQMEITTLNDKINMQTETNDGNDKEQQTLAPAGLLGGGDAPDFISEIRDIINRHSMENGSNTPDFILAQYLTNCLRAWNTATTAREKWYGREPKPCQPSNESSSPTAGGGRGGAQNKHEKSN